ncbi:hypothetical protein RvY_01745-2 [Ramazzottius varieornatus]|uniref:SPX domain-containing protein n=1 Tax=Ramazzottius varieornatus TaxID=947166 RepID=A0A1D1UND4_RAMVA|nr:hypothetical protein RvY_01745-2 [Ramazzottius varieornatus]
MKFGEHLISHVTPEWRTQYINYDDMKEMLTKVISHAPKDIGTLRQDRQPDGAEALAKYFANFDESFFHYCEGELQRVNTFFIEKLAEAQRKFAGLKGELKAYLAHKDASAPKDHYVSKIPWFADMVDKEARKKKRRYHRLHDLKLAFSEFYLSLIFLQNFRNLNFTGFRKILKKHDKLLGTKRGNKWRIEKIETAPFYTNTEIDVLISETENMVTYELEGGDRGKAMQRLRVPPLNEQATHSTFFLLGFFLGCFVVLICFVINRAALAGPPLEVYLAPAGTNVTPGYNIKFANTTSFDPTIMAPCHFWKDSLPSGTNDVCYINHMDWNVPVRLYRGPFLVICMVFLVALNVNGWRAAGVNHVLIFEIDPRNHLSQHEMMQLAACMGVIWAISLLLYFQVSDLAVENKSVASYWVPITMCCTMLLFFINPFPVLFYPARKWVLKTLGRIICAPFYPVGFPDFWLADQLMSLSTALLDLGYVICYYSFEVPWVTGGLQTNWGMCATNDNFTRPILSILPAWFRFAQCLRRYRDSGLPYPHLVNAGKYSTTFFVVGFSVFNKKPAPFALWITCMIINALYSLWWDLRMDWGFIDKHCRDIRLRKGSLTYSSVWYYYFAIAQNVVLRFLRTTLISPEQMHILSDEISKTVVAVCELFRRFVWNFFRLENEHLNNCEEFRAVRNITVGRRVDPRSLSTTTMLPGDIERPSQPPKPAERLVPRVRSTRWLM